MGEVKLTVKQKSEHYVAKETINGLEELQQSQTQ